MFYYGLAEKLGYVSISLMLREVTSAELTEWQVYFQIKEDYAENQKIAEDAKARAKRDNR